MTLSKQRKFTFICLLEDIKGSKCCIIKVCQYTKGLGSRRGEIGPAIEMHTDLKYVYMVYFIEKNRNFICLVLKL